MRGVELAHHVIEQHQWSGPVGVEQGLALGEEQGEESEALLAL